MISIQLPGAKPSTWSRPMLRTVSWLAVAPDGVGYAEDAGDAGLDGGVVARPLEGGGADGTGGVDLDAVVLVLHAGVAGVGGETAWAGGCASNGGGGQQADRRPRATDCRQWRR